MTCCGKDDVLDDFDDDVDLQVGLLTKVSCPKHPIRRLQQLLSAMSSRLRRSSKQVR